jgi:hypothetical protein
VVLSATASMRLAQGKEVTIGRDAKGRVFVRSIAIADRGLNM